MLLFVGQLSILAPKEELCFIDILSTLVSCRALNLQVQSPTSILSQKNWGLWAMRASTLETGCVLLLTFASGQREGRSQHQTSMKQSLSSFVDICRDVDAQDQIVENLVPLSVLYFDLWTISAESVWLQPLL